MKLRQALALGIAAVPATMFVPPMAGPARASDGAYADAVKSTVRVVAVLADGTRRYGTGWVIEAKSAARADAAVVITAQHIVVGAVKIYVVSSGSTMDDALVASVFRSSTDRDIAFMEVKDLDSPPLKVRADLPVVGADIGALGYTDKSDANETSTVAKVASVKRGGLSKSFRGPLGPLAQAPVNQIEYDAPVLPGFSGGAVLDSAGCVVGMTISNGGTIQIGKTISISTAQGVATGVGGNEVLAFSQEAIVKATPCGGGGPNPQGTPTPPPPPPQPPTTTCPTMASNFDSSGAPCIPRTWVDVLKSPIGIALGVAALALLAIIIALVMMSRRKKGGSQDVGYAPPSTPLLTPTPTPAPGPSTGGGTSVQTRTLKLTGQGPTGESIDLRFSGDDLMARPIMLGREGDAQGVIPDNRSQRLVSSKHAILSYDGRAFAIEDNKSTNKTFVGGQALAPGVKRTLSSGDSIRLADVTLNVMID